LLFFDTSPGERCTLATTGGKTSRRESDAKSEAPARNGERLTPLALRVSATQRAEQSPAKPNNVTVPAHQLPCWESIVGHQAREM